MKPYQIAFIEFALQQEIILFGDFTLKSGRQSPYFFNAVLFNTGETLAKVGQFYAAAIQEFKFEYDVLYGPAYKGIPLVCTTAIALANQFDTNKPYCFNRKEEKDHGCGGRFVGAPLQGRVLIVDDVITAGTAIRESMAHIEPTGAELAGVMIAFDRQEKGTGELSAINEVENNYHIKVGNIITFSHLIDYINDNSQYKSHLDKCFEYRNQYGVV